VRVLIVDDHAVVRRGCAAARRGGRHRGRRRGGHAREAIFEARALKPDVILLDVVMPGRERHRGAAELLHEAPDAKVLVLSMQDDPSYVREAFAAGASGYVLKEAADAEVVAAMREVAAGGRYVHPSSARASSPPRPRRARRAEADPLSDREREVLRLLALGHTNQEIAKQLYISVRTAETHRAHIMQKLRLETRAELVRYALAHGLLEVLVRKARWPVDQPSPRSESRREHRMVDDVIHEPLDLGGLEHEHDVGRRQVHTVAMEAEVAGLERRPRSDQLLCVRVCALVQPCDDHQAVHRSSLVRRLTNGRARSAPRHQDRR
jgi:two-component system response regulator NreC